MKNDEIKAVELVRRIRDEQYEILSRKSLEERREFYREKAKSLHEELGVERPETGDRGR